MQKFPPSELVLTEKNTVYHLGLHPSQLAEKVILVGDQDRVELISRHFDSIEHVSQHREFVCHTGMYKTKRISVISTGIGTDNIDIVINELDALVNIDLTLRQEKDTHTALSIVRIGTCGILQKDVPVHSFILSEAAIGIDNVAHFYQLETSSFEKELLKALHNQVVLPPNILPYCSEASKNLVQDLDSDKVFKGITVTSSGFYGPQGRLLRIPLQRNDLNEELSSFQFEGKYILNFEMESSALFALGKALGHACTTICLGVANRPSSTFSKDYSQPMQALISYVLDRI